MEVGGRGRKERGRENDDQCCELFPAASEMEKRGRGWRNRGREEEVRQRRDLEGVTATGSGVIPPEEREMEEMERGRLPAIVELLFARDDGDGRRIEGDEARE
ncbi:hypothetical protein HAX54_047483, partial [Datura stramonium]|nr:hypothetical protein [Datura stramonium]